MRRAREDRHEVHAFDRSCDPACRRLGRRSGRTGLAARCRGSVGRRIAGGRRLRRQRGLRDLARPLRGPRRGERLACGQGRASGLARGYPRQHAARIPRRQSALAACADRLAGGQGRGRHFRRLDAGARDRRARPRRPRRRRAGARRDGQADRDGSRDIEAGLARSAKAEGRPDRRRRLVAISRGRHRSGRRNLHQGAADVGGRRGRRSGLPLGLALEQSGARSGAADRLQRRDRRRDARQRRQPARFRRPQRAAAGQGEGPERELRRRPVPASVRRNVQPRRREGNGYFAGDRRRGRVPTGGWLLDASDQPRSRRSRRAAGRPESRLPRWRGALPGHHVCARRRPRRARQGLHPQARRRGRRQRRQARTPGQSHATRA